MTTPEIWSGTSGPRTAKIVIVGEAQGSEEAEVNRPFVGPSGRVLDQMLLEAGIKRDECFVTNVVNARPPANDMSAWFEPGAPTLGGLSPGPQITAGLETLYAQIRAIAPKLVIACGNYPLWALTSRAGSQPDGPRPRTPSGILDFRGSQLYALESWKRDPKVGSGASGLLPVLPIAHPAAVLRDWTLRAPTVHDLRGRTPLALAGKWAPGNRLGGAPHVELLLEFERAHTALSALIATADIRASGGRTLDLVCDIETWRASLITCVGLSPHDGLAFVFPLVTLGAEKGTIKSFWTVEQECILLRLLCLVLQHPAVRLIGQNFLYDRAFLWDQFRLELKTLWDTLVAQNLLFLGTQKDLGYLSSLYCRHHVYWKNSNKDWSLDLSDGLETHLRYNGEDCCRTFEIYTEQRRALQEIEPSEARLKLWPAELAKIELAWSMQKRGTRVNETARSALALRLIEARTALAEWLESVVPQTVLDAEGATPKSGTRWFASSQQTAVLLYEVLGLRIQRDRKTGSVSTADEALGTLREAYPRLSGLFDALLEFRSLRVLFSTFVEAKLEWNGRFAPAFNPAGTSTFRFSSSKNPFKRGGNAQNIPQGDEE